jgi:hypothetical protein
MPCRADMMSGRMTGTRNDTDALSLPSIKDQVSESSLTQEPGLFFHLPFKVRAPAIATRFHREVFLKKDAKTFETFETLCGCCHQAAP